MHSTYDKTATTAIRMAPDVSLHLAIRVTVLIAISARVHAPVLVIPIVLMLSVLMLSIVVMVVAAIVILLPSGASEKEAATRTVPLVDTPAIDHEHRERRRKPSHVDPHAGTVADQRDVRLSANDFVHGDVERIAVDVPVSGEEQTRRIRLEPDNLRVLRDDS